MIKTVMGILCKCWRETDVINGAEGRADTEVNRRCEQQQAEAFVRSECMGMT